ncbi:MAG TPA: DUF4386 domain-containing protein [Vicinamibacterales bacterium]|nr:DUF4386 domain-containing protein [Vicinamibacterales bacterium]
MNSDDRSARVAGLLYLLFIPTAGLAFGFGQFLLTGDAATVFVNIESHRRFFEFAIFLGVVGFIDYIVVALLLYRLLAPAGRAAATLMVALVAVSVPISLAAMAARMDVLTMLDSRQAIAALNDDQLKAHVLLVVRHADNLLLVSAMFWGLWLVPYGWLVYRCGFLPRILGILLMLGAPFYVLASVGPIFDTNYAATRLAGAVGVVSGLPGVVGGEFVTCLWLVIFGTRGRRVREVEREFA